MTTIATRAIQVQHDTDPKQTILEAIKPYFDDLDGYELIQSDCLVAVYKRPEKTKGGVFLTQNIRDEDKFQGIVGLLLKKSPLAFRDDETHTFPVQPQIGDWVQFRPSETVSFHFGDTQCRLVEDVCIRAILPRPDIVY